jgi:hypothetical protein
MVPHLSYLALIGAILQTPIRVAFAHGSFQGSIPILLLAPDRPAILLP